MTQLSNIINRVVQEALTKEGFEPRLLAPSVWEELDEENRKACGLAEIVRKMKSAANTLAQDSISRLASSQIELPFKLSGAVAIDVEARKIKLTEALSQMEFKRAMEIRRKQIKDDQAQLKEWEDAESLANPYWRKHPDWTFGQCVKAMSKDMRAAKKKGRAA